MFVTILLILAIPTLVIGGIALTDYIVGSLPHPIDTITEEDEAWKAREARKKTEKILNGADKQIAFFFLCSVTALCAAGF